jgi:hypothetical protein
MPVSQIIDQWRAFLNKAKLNAEDRPPSEIATASAQVLMPISEAVAQHKDYERTWNPGGRWT